MFSGKRERENPAIPLLCNYLKEIKSASQQDTCNPKFTAALFTTEKTWKQPKCVLIGEWVKNTCHINICETKY